MREERPLEVALLLGETRFGGVRQLRACANSVHLSVRAKRLSGYWSDARAQIDRPHTWLQYDDTHHARHSRLRMSSMRGAQVPRRAPYTIRRYSTSEDTTPAEMTHTEWRSW